MRDCHRQQICVDLNIDNRYFVDIYNTFNANGHANIHKRKPIYTKFHFTLHSFNEYFLSMAFIRSSFSREFNVFSVVFFFDTLLLDTILPFTGSMICICKQFIAENFKSYRPVI